MSDITTHLLLPYIMASQAQKHVTHNEALRLLDAMVQLSVLDRTRTMPPASPVDGDRHIVASGATSLWAGWDLNVAFWVDGIWMRLVPRPGWLAWIAVEQAFVVWNGSAWDLVGEPVDVSDAIFSLVNDADPTRKALFSLSGINTGTSLDDILDYGAQHVIFATGSSWDTTGLSAPIHDHIKGADASKPEIVTPDQYVRDGKKVGKRVVVIDHDAYFMGSAVAIDLAEKGHEVTYLTHNESVGPYLRFTLEEQRVHMKLMELGVKLLPLQFAISVEGGKVTSVNKWTAEETETAYDSVLMVTYRKSECAIYDQLQAQPERLKEAGITSIHLIGDAHTPGMIAQATFSGARLAREFDTEDPDTHQPFIRERRLIGATEDDYRLGARTLSASIGKGH